MCSKNIETEAVSAEIDMNNEWNVNFYQNSFFGIEHSYSSELFEALLKLLFWYYQVL